MLDRNTSEREVHVLIVFGLVFSLRLYHTGTLENATRELPTQSGLLIASIMIAVRLGHFCVPPYPTILITLPHIWLGFPPLELPINPGGAACQVDWLAARIAILEVS